LKRKCFLRRPVCFGKKRTHEKKTGRQQNKGKSQSGAQRDVRDTKGRKSRL